MSQKFALIKSLKQKIDELEIELINANQNSKNQTFQINTESEDKIINLVFEKPPKPEKKKEASSSEA